YALINPREVAAAARTEGTGSLSLAVCSFTWISYGLSCSELRLLIWEDCASMILRISKDINPAIAISVKRLRCMASLRGPSDLMIRPPLAGVYLRAAWMSMGACSAVAVAGDDQQLAHDVQVRCHRGSRPLGVLRHDTRIDLFMLTKSLFSSTRNFQCLPD